MIKIDRGNFASNINFLKKANILEKKQRILEVGSGTGHLARYLTDRGYHIVGTEINRQYIDFAKERFGISLLEMKGENLQLKNKTFDVVLSFDVFEHIINTDEHLKEVRRVLKPHGYYLLSTPNKWTNIPFEIISKKSLFGYKKYHCSLHNYWQIKKRFNYNGFSIRFIDILVANNFFKKKVKKNLGFLGLFLLKTINLDKLPLFLRTNFYIVAQKN